jgi:hypothetical protein
VGDFCSFLPAKANLAAVLGDMGLLSGGDLFLPRGLGDWFKDILDGLLYGLDIYFIFDN